MKILVYVPLYPRELFLQPRTWASVKALEWDHPLEIVLGRLDSKDFSANLLDKAAAYNNLTAKHNRARKMALDGDYDAVLFVEADMILPRHTLKRLVATEADIAYGLYVSRHAPHQWLAYAQLSGYSGISMSEMPEHCKALWGQVVESAGVGMGCTLVWRHVLEEIEFRCPSPHVADDWYFAMDVAEAGFTQKHDLGVVCGHIDGDTVYWPDQNGGFSVQYLDDYFTTITNPTRVAQA